MANIERDEDQGLNTAIYTELRRRFVTGKISPGHGLSTRGLATELGVSQTPVRDALSRLAAEGAVEIRSKRRVLAPAMTRERFDELLRCRLLLEPEAAVLALPHIDDARLARLRAYDAALNRAIRDGNADGYVEANYGFHFTMYDAPGRGTMGQLIETLWLQIGPFMRLMCGRIESADLVDQHQAAIDAIAAKDADKLRAAITGDIADGMAVAARTGFG